MKDRSALPLFDWQPPIQIIPFPANKRIGKARSVAQQIVKRKTEKSRDRYWESTVLTFSKQMERAGINQPEIEQEISAFAELVQREINRLDLYLNE